MTMLSDLRDATVTALIAQGVCGGKVKASRYTPLKKEDLPLAAVYVASDRMTPLGDANAGPVEFLHSASVAVEMALTAGADESGSDGALTQVELAQRALLDSDVWMREVEGVEAVEVDIQQAEQGEVRFVAARVVFTANFRSTWAPTITDDLAKITGRKPGHGVDFIPTDGTIEAEFNIDIETE